jgi:hypothetical protein
MEAEGFFQSMVGRNEICVLAFMAEICKGALGVGLRLLLGWQVSNVQVPDAHEGNS